jgi:hypothetical protein
MAFFTAHRLICDSPRQSQSVNLCPYAHSAQTFDYRASFWQFNGHMQTIWPSLFRRVKFNYQWRERLELPDGDFVDLDWTFCRLQRKNCWSSLPMDLKAIRAGTMYWAWPGCLHSMVMMRLAGTAAVAAAN